MSPLWWLAFIAAWLMIPAVHVVKWYFDRRVKEWRQEDAGKEAGG